MPAIDPVTILERLKALSLASPDDARFKRALDWVSAEIALDARAQREVAA